MPPSIGRVLLAASLLALGLPGPAGAQSGVWIELRPGAPRESIERLKRDLGAVEHSSEARGVQFWAIAGNQDASRQALGASDVVGRFDLWDGGATDLLAPAEEGELTEAARKRLAKIGRPKHLKRVTLARIAPDPAARHLLRSGTALQGHTGGARFQLRLGDSERFAVQIVEVVPFSGSKPLDVFSTRIRLAAPGEPPEDRESEWTSDGVLTYAPRSLYGRLATNAGDYTISPLGDGFHAIGEIDYTALRDEAPEHRRSNLPARQFAFPPWKFLFLGDIGAGKGCHTGASYARKWFAFLRPTIGVGIMFSGQAIDAVPVRAGQAVDDAMREFSESLVQLVNDSFKNSDVMASVYLADVGMPDPIDAIDGLQVNELLRLIVPLPPALPGPMSVPFRTFRDDKLADVVITLVDNGSSRWYWGYSPGKDEVLDERNAFSVVEIGPATAWLTFNHELGHQFGASHNKEAIPPNDVYIQPYGRAFMNNCKWRTIMSTSDPCTKEVQRINYWSNCMRRYPSWAFLGIFGDPMGDSDHANNARMINEMAGQVSRYR